MRKLILSFTFLIICINCIVGQSKIIVKKEVSPVKFSPTIVQGYFNLLGNDFKEQFSSPFKMKKKQFLHFGIFAAATTAFIFSDPSIDGFARNAYSKSSAIRAASPVITNFGAKYGFYTLGALELTGLIFNNKKLIVSGLLATQAIITSGLLSRLGKIVFSRERPSTAYATDAYKKGGTWHGANGYMDFLIDNKRMPGNGYDAFPSGHTSTAFSIATVYAEMYKDHPVIPVISYGIASLVGLSRLTENVHWMSDVFVGAALGYLCGRHVVRNYQKLNNVAPSQRKHKNISISLNYAEKSYFAGINYIF